MATKPIPEGYTTVSQYVAVEDAAAAIEFYTRAFGARERGRMPGPNGTIAHAELELGDSVVMLSDQFPQSTIKPPKQLGGTSVGLFMYVEDVDAAMQRAVEAGAAVTSPASDMFWGDRFGRLADPFGHEWQLATRKEDLSPEAVMERGKEMMASMG